MRLRVQIVRFVEWHQPPIVEAELLDVDGRRHAFIDKEAIFTSEWLDANSTYPQPGVIRCELLASSTDSGNRNLIRVPTEKPDGIESTEGLSQFVVRDSQLT